MVFDKILNGMYPYIIAEIGINHNGDIKLAKEMIDAAQDSGVDCVKFQSFIVDSYISKLAPRANYQQQESVITKSQYDIIKECELNKEETIELMKYAQKAGIDFLSTPFEIFSFRMLQELELPAIKISSCNLTNFPFLREIANTKIPVLLSTGMSDMCEVLNAVEVFKQSGSPLMLFQCTSNYPSKIENANLNVIKTYRNLFNIPVGFSDHTVGNTAAIASVALGATSIEKHFTLSRKLPGIDQQASIEPDELKTLIEAVRDCKDSLGGNIKFLTQEEEDTKIALRRSLVAAEDIKSGDVLTEKMVVAKRPGNGLTTDLLPHILNRTLKKDIKADHLLSFDHFIT